MSLPYLHVPRGGSKRLVFQTYITDRTYNDEYKKFPPLISGKSICFSITPQGAGVMGLFIRGGLYRIKKETEILIGIFQCQTLGVEDVLAEGKQFIVSDASCLKAPANVEFIKGQNIIARINAGFSTPPNDQTYDEIVPITAHMPVEPPH